MVWLSQNFVPLLNAVVPVLALVLTPFLANRGVGQLRKLRQYAEIRSLLPEANPSFEGLDELIEGEIKRVSNVISKKGKRQVDGVNLAAIILVTLVGAAIVFSGSLWAQSLPTPWSVFAWILVSVIGLTALLLILIGGVSNFYRDEESVSEESVS